MSQTHRVSDIKDVLHPRTLYFTHNGNSRSFKRIKNFNDISQSGFALFKFKDKNENWMKYNFVL